MSNEKLDLQKIKDFLKSKHWIFAKTYAKTAPHEYIVLDKNNRKEREIFISIAFYIREFGIEEFFYNHPFKYLYIDNHKYWTMEKNIEDTDLINRVKIKK